MSDQWKADERRTELRLRHVLDELIHGLDYIRLELAVQAVALVQLRVEMDELKREGASTTVKVVAKR